MPTIVADDKVVTQINVFTTTPDHQQALIDLLKEAAHAVRDVPGWRSASIRRERDGTRVVNYAQCDSFDAWKLVFEKLQDEGFIARNKALGTASPGLYEVVFTLVKT
ncbi:antibiotic biosynthesis monooxygenase family protein [Rhizobacter sp. OV335]|uniref:antibiotic biosynthesis monooxygenase family protein n=1 Tax=Rhizobacter sp. OV335 TaxID=1500264 RepID=UPI000923AE4D|nr:antibiotic biosynthesis monooxygenase family protein [Rhizobacter sp. OV335]SHM63976.1 Antibiotic biosynthesis monooxygenase [Rhizobacter sp. OV335]